MLPVDDEEEEVHLIAEVLESEHKLANYVGVSVVRGIVEADGVDDTENTYFKMRCACLFVPNGLFFIPIEEGLCEPS